MDTYSFTLLIDGADVASIGVANALFANGCDDASFRERDGLSFADFDREAPGFLDAVTDAVNQMETAVPGLRVLRVEPDELVTASVIAERAARSRESIRLLFADRRGPGGFPAPEARIDRRTRVWRWSLVAKWLRDTMGIEVAAVIDPSELAAVNAALEYRLVIESGYEARLTRLIEVLRRGTNLRAARAHPTVV
jgi:hypothetical protein